MDKELQALLEAAKAAAVAAHRGGYKIEWVSFQQGDHPDEIEVGIRVSKDVMVSIVRANDAVCAFPGCGGFPVLGSRRCRDHALKGE